MIASWPRSGAAGDPLSIAELARPPIPPEQNAATYLRRVATDAAAIDKELWEIPEWKDYICGRLTYPVPPGVHKALAAVFRAYPRVIPLLQQAAACSDYDARLDYTLPPNEFTAQLSDFAVKYRDYARALAYWSKLMVAEGNRDEGVRSALVLLRLARHFDQNSLFIDHVIVITMCLIAIDEANFALQTGPISAKVRDALEAELAIHERTDRLIPALKNERASSLDNCRAWQGRNIWLVGRPLCNWRTSDRVEVYNAMIATLESSGSYRHHFERMQEIASTRPVFSGFPPMLTVSVRMRAMIRSLRVLSALQTHVPKGSGKIPRLSELGLPAETTTDPFNGEPLHVKRLPEGWLIYSVGEDLKDDGGKLPPCELPCDYGVGPPPPTKSP